MVPPFLRSPSRLLLACAGLLALSASSLAAARPPNVILILTDDQGYADVGVYGAQGYTTPNLDRLAGEGIRFTDFHVAQAVCSASRAALLTGCYPNRIGITGALEPWDKIGLHADELTLPQMMKQKGYATGMVGKWHLGTPVEFLPTHRGFDEFFGLPYSNDEWPFHPEKPGVFPPLPLIEGDRAINPGISKQDMEQITTQYTEHAVSFIERNRERPFFLYVAHTMPHVPLAVSDKFRGKTKRGLYGDANLKRDSIFFDDPHYCETTTPVSAVRMGDWKLLEYLEDQRVELYHLSEDLGEKTDLAAQQPERAADLLHRLHAWREEVGAAMPTANPNFKGKR